MCRTAGGSWLLASVAHGAPRPVLVVALRAEPILALVGTGRTTAAAVLLLLVAKAAAAALLLAETTAAAAKSTATATTTCP